MCQHSMTKVHNRRPTEFCRQLTFVNSKSDRCRYGNPLNERWPTGLYMPLCA